MRAATFGFVLAIHVMFFLLFAVLRSPDSFGRRAGAGDELHLSAGSGQTS